MVDNVLIEKLRSLVAYLIKIGVDNFIFGSNSEFDNLCYQIVSEFKTKYNIKLINYCCGKEIRLFDEVKKPVNLKNAGKYVYIERNKAMINDSSIVVLYYNERYEPSSKTKSGTAIAYKYAETACKTIFNLF